MKDFTRTKKGPGRVSRHPINPNNPNFGDKKARKAFEHKLGLNNRGY